MRHRGVPLARLGLGSALFYELIQLTRTRSPVRTVSPWEGKNSREGGRRVGGARSWLGAAPDGSASGRPGRPGERRRAASQRQLRGGEASGRGWRRVAGGPAGWGYTGASEGRWVSGAGPGGRFLGGMSVEKGVSLFTAEDGNFEAVSAAREDQSETPHGSARSHDQEGGPARYKFAGLTTPEERETAKALRVAKDLRKSSSLFERYNKDREEYKKQLEDENERRYKARELRKKEMLLKWSKKLDKSSFLVDQVAESERIDEEQRVKLEEEAKRSRLFEERKQRIKTEIILKALAESNDLEQLRQEKRLIQEEERRLKVQAGLEKRDVAVKKEELLKKTAEERKRRNEQQFMQQRNRLAMQQAEDERRREAIIMKMQMKGMMT